MPKPSTYHSLPDKDREWLEYRQAQNGWSDIDGAAEELKQRGHEIPRSTVGDINKYLKNRAAAIKARQEGTTALLNALGENAHDIGLANVALLHDMSQEIISKLNMQDIDLTELSPEKRLATFFKLAGVQMESSIAAKNLQSARVELESRVNNLADEVEALAKKGGISDETVRELKQRVLKLNG